MATDFKISDERFEKVRQSYAKSLSVLNNKQAEAELLEGSMAAFKWVVNESPQVYAGMSDGMFLSVARVFYLGYQCGIRDMGFRFEMDQDAKTTSDRNTSKHSV